MAIAFLLLFCAAAGASTTTEGALNEDLSPAWLCQPLQPAQPPLLTPKSPSLLDRSLRSARTEDFFVASDGVLTALRIPTRSTLKPYLGAALALPTGEEEPSVAFLSESDSPRLALGFNCLVGEGVRFGLDLRFLNDTFSSLVSPFVDDRDAANNTSIRFGYEVSF